MNGCKVRNTADSLVVLYIPCLKVVQDGCDPTRAQNNEVEAEKEERSHRPIANAVISPVAVMVHQKDTLVTDSAMMHLRSLDCTAFLASISVIFVIYLLCLIICR